MSKCSDFSGVFNALHQRLLVLLAAVANGSLCYTCSQQATDGSCKSVSRCQSNQVSIVFMSCHGSLKEIDMT